MLVRRKKHKLFRVNSRGETLEGRKRAGLEKNSAIVRDIEDLAALEHALVENLHRQDLGPLEEAAAYQQLIDDFDLTQQSVAKRVGKKQINRYQCITAFAITILRSIISPQWSNNRWTC